MGTALKHPVLNGAKPSLVIFDIRALWRSASPPQSTLTLFTKLRDH